jgi:hypothetical protein
MELTIKVQDIKDDDVHVIVDVYKDGKISDRRIFDKAQIINEVDDVEYEIRKAVREILILNSDKTATEQKTALDEIALNLRG